MGHPTSPSFGYSCRRECLGHRPAKAPDLRGGVGRHHLQLCWGGGGTCDSSGRTATAPSPRLVLHSTRRRPPPPPRHPCRAGGADAQAPSPPTAAAQCEGRSQWGRAAAAAPIRGAGTGGAAVQTRRRRRRERVAAGSGEEGLGLLRRREYSLEQLPERPCRGPRFLAALKAPAGLLRPRRRPSLLVASAAPGGRN